MGKNIRSSSSPKALATSFPIAAGRRDGRSPSQRGSVLSPGRRRGLGRDDGGGRHDRVRGPTSSPWEPSGLSLGPYAERDRLPRRPRESAAATGSRPCWQGGGFGDPDKPARACLAVDEATPLAMSPADRAACEDTMRWLVRRDLVHATRSGGQLHGLRRSIDYLRCQGLRVPARGGRPG